jgi:hypothetical protein
MAVRMNFASFTVLVEVRLLRHLAVGESEPWAMWVTKRRRGRLQSLRAVFLRDDEPLVRPGVAWGRKALLGSREFHPCVSSCGSVLVCFRF